MNLAQNVQDRKRKKGDEAVSVACFSKKNQDDQAYPLRFFASEAPEALQKVKEHFLWFGHVLLPTRVCVRVRVPVCLRGLGEILGSTLAHGRARRNQKKSKVKGRKALKRRKKRKKKRKRRQKKR